MADDTPDPIYAAIVRHRLAFEALQADGGTNAETVVVTPPPPADGCLALLSHLAEVDPDAFFIVEA